MEYESFTSKPAPGIPVFTVHKQVDGDITNDHHDTNPVSPKHNNSFGQVNLREFWMRDDTSKLCYKCEQPFSLLKRRHHCRGCGLVFCGSCTPFNVNGKRFGYPGTVRVCDACMTIATEGTEQKITTELYRQRTTAVYSPWGGNKPDTIVGYFQSILRSTIRHTLEQSIAKLQHLLPDDCHQWTDILFNLCDSACSDLVIRPDLGDGLDPSQYVMIITVPGGSPRQSIFTNGCMFPADVAHREMLNSITQPRIAILSGDVRFAREASHLVSLDTLVEQEREWTQLIVDRLYATGVNLLVAGGSVSVLANAMCIASGIAVVQCVSPTVLARLSRATGAVELQTLDHIDPQDPQLGTCDSWQVTRVNIATESTTTNRSYDPSTSVPLMRFDGCASHLGSSICLRGANESALNVLGSILNDAIVKQFNLMSQFSLYLDTLPSYIEQTVQQTMNAQLKKSVSISSSDKRDVTKLQKSITKTHQDPQDEFCLLSQTQQQQFYNFVDSQSLHVTRVWLNDILPTCKPKSAIIQFNGQMDQSLHQFLFKFGFLPRMVWPGSKTPIHWLSSKHKLVFLHHRLAVAVSGGEVDAMEFSDRPSVEFQLINNELVAVSSESARTRLFDSIDDESTVRFWYRYKTEQEDGKMGGTQNDQRVISEQSTEAQVLSHRSLALSFGKFLQQLVDEEGVSIVPWFNNDPNYCKHIITSCCFAWRNCFTKFSLVPIGSCKLLPTCVIEVEIDHYQQLLFKQIESIEETVNEAVSVLNKLNWEGLPDVRLWHSEPKTVMELAFEWIRSQLVNLKSSIAVSSTKLYPTGLLMVCNIEFWYNSIMQLVKDELEVQVSSLAVEKQKSERVGNNIPLKKSSEMNNESCEISQTSNSENELQTSTLSHATTNKETLDPPSATTTLDSSSATATLDSSSATATSESTKATSESTKAISESTKATSESTKATSEPTKATSESTKVTSEPTPSKTTSEPTSGQAKQLGTINDHAEQNKHSEKSNTQVKKHELPPTPRTAMPFSPYVGLDPPDFVVHTKNTVTKQTKEEIQAGIETQNDASSTMSPNETVQTTTSLKLKVDDLPSDLGQTNQSKLEFESVLQPPEASARNMSMKLLNRSCEGANIVPWMGEGIVVRPDELSSWISYALSTDTHWFALTAKLRKSLGGSSFKSKKEKTVGSSQADDESEVLESTKTRTCSDETGKEMTSTVAANNSIESIELGNEETNATVDVKPLAVSSSTDQVTVPGVSLCDAQSHSTPEDDEAPLSIAERLQSIFPKVPRFPSEARTYFECTDQQGTELYECLKQTNLVLETSKWEHVLNSGIKPVHLLTNFAFEHWDDNTVEIGFTVEAKYALRFAVLRHLLYSGRKAEVNIETASDDNGSNNNNDGSGNCSDLDESCITGFMDSQTQFVASMLRCEAWETSGGQTNAVFFRTYDEQFVMKTVRQEEVESFDGLAMKYFAYLADMHAEGNVSLLSKIVGIYTVQMSRTTETPKPGSSKVVGKKRTVLVMENTLWGPEQSMIRDFTVSGDAQKDQNVKTFDLKGNQRNRYISNPKPGAVLLDSNFFEWRKGIPVALRLADYNVFVAAIHRDAEFLASVGVVDYSMLVQVNEVGERVYVGIIDYLQVYNYKKMIESKMKKAGMIAGQLEPTVIGPTKYAERFVGRFRQYFVPVVKLG